jgi:hypothetical protein
MVLMLSGLLVGQHPLAQWLLFFSSNHGEGSQMLIQKISNTGFNHILLLTRRKQIIQYSDKAKQGSTSSADDK